MNAPGSKTVTILRRLAQAQEYREDCIALEEPLEIRLGFQDGGQRRQRSVSITMRTPGHDTQLAAGFLFTEGILTNPNEIAGIHSCGPRKGKPFYQNVVRIELTPDVRPDWDRLQRHFYTSSSCGVCGKTSLEALRAVCPFELEETHFTISGCLLHELPDRLREGQTLFGQTGGLHASALVNSQGNFLCVREDVGRHNALDKVIGAAFFDDQLPLRENFVMVSGRASFELVQKAVMAGIPMMVAVGAPSSLAVELAEDTGMTLVGFLRNDRFNIYHGAHRVVG